MGYLDKSKRTVTAHFTKRGRELLANAIAGDTSGDYIITQYALGDDEIDYSLYDETLSSNLMGRVIENAPILESFLSDQEQMNFFIHRETPPITQQSTVSNVPAQIVLKGQGDVFDIEPVTENFVGGEDYEFVLEHDNIVEMYDGSNPPVADFTYSIYEEVSDNIAPKDDVVDDKDTLPKEEKNVSSTSFDEELLIKDEIYKEKETNKETENLKDKEEQKTISDTEKEIVKEVEKAIEKQTVATYPPIANFNWFEVTD
jgi:hypothetical protein